MKSIFAFILGVVMMVAGSVQATTLGWDLSGGVFQPIKNAWNAEVKIPYLTATSTATSTIPTLDVSTLKFGGEEGTSWSDFCVSVTGDASLCDGNDAIGSGDLVGPASATDNALTRFDTTTGKLVQNSGAVLDDNANLTLFTPSGTSETSGGLNISHTNGVGTSQYRISQQADDFLKIKRTGDTTSDGDTWSLIELHSPTAETADSDDTEATISLVTSYEGSRTYSRIFDLYNDEYSRDNGMGFRQLYKNTTANPIRFEFHDKSVGNGAFTLGEIYGTSGNFSFTSIDSEKTGVTPSIDDWVWDNGNVYFADDTKIISIDLDTPSSGITTFGINRALIGSPAGVAARGKNIKEIMRLSSDRQLLVRKGIAGATTTVAEFGGDVAIDGTASTSILTVDTEVYGVGWNGSNEVPTKDALYDKIETIGGGGGGGDISTTSADYIVYKSGSTVYGVDGNDMTPISSGSDLGAVLEVVMAHATDTKGVAGGRIAIKAGEYTSNGTTVYGENSNNNSTWIFEGAGTDATNITQSSGDFMNFTDRAEVVVKDMSIDLSTTENAFTAQGSATGIRSVWNSEFKNLKIYSSTGNHTGHAFNFGNDFRNIYSNIELFGVGNGFRSYTEGSAFNVGDSVFERWFCELNSSSNGICFDLDGVGGSVINQSSFIDINGIADGSGDHTFLRLNNANWNTFSGLNAEQFATTTEMIDSEGNTLEFEYVTPKTSGGNYFAYDSTSISNSIGCKYLDNPTGVHSLIVDDNTARRTPNVLQGVGGNTCKITGSGSYTTSVTTASVIRDITDDVTGVGTIAAFNEVKAMGNRIYLNYQTALDSFIEYTTSALKFFTGDTERMAISSTGDVSIANLVSCDTIDTDANGVMSCGTDDSSSGTVTSVNMSVPTGLSISGNPITTSGTLALTLTSGYTIPLTADTTNWNTAFLWGDHSGAGYGDVTAASTFGTDNVLIRSDGTGKGVQSSGVIIDDSNNIVTLGRLGVGTQVFGGTRLGDSNFQTPSIDTQSLNIKNSSQGTISSLFATEDVGNGFVVSSYRSFTQNDHVLKVLGKNHSLTTDDGSATLSLVRQTNDSNKEGLDLFTNGFNSSGTDIATTSGIVMLAEGTGTTSDFGFWYKDNGVVSYDNIFLIDGTTKDMLFSTNISILGTVTTANLEVTGNAIVPTEVYGPAWNGSNEVPTKDALYDKIELLLATADIDTSAELASIVTDETGTGALVFGTSPTFTTSVDLPTGAINTATEIGNDIITHAQILDSDQTDTVCKYIEDPVAEDDLKSLWANKTANNWLLTEIWAESDQTVALDVRVDDGTPADVNGTDITPTAGEAEDTSLSGDTTLAAGEELDLEITSVTNTPTWLSVCITYQIVD